jgi:hypothetical protein
MPADAGFVVRAVIADYGNVGVYEAASASGLEAFLGSQARTRVRLHVLRVERLGLLVQKPPSNSVEVLWEPQLRFTGSDGVVCRYHEGPRGEPWRHWYCSRPAVTRDGYCSVHRNSWKALYERCAQGVDSACIQVSRMVSGERFSVYVLYYGGLKVKVGMTQDWRLLWRIAEQPHVAVARVYTGDLLSARELERRLGKHRLATEGAQVRVQQRLRSSVAVLGRLVERGEYAKAAQVLASALSGLGFEGEYEAYTVLPRSLDWLVTARRVDSLERLRGRRLRLLDYWAGILYLDAEGEHVAVGKHVLQHILLHGSIEGKVEEPPSNPLF